MISALNRAKSLLDKAMEHANRTQLYFDRLIEIRTLLLELKNHTDQSVSKSRDAMNMNERNRRLLRTVLVRSSYLCFFSQSLCSFEVLSSAECINKINKYIN